MSDANSQSIPESLQKWRDQLRPFNYEGDNIFVHTAGKAETEGHGVLIVHGFPGSSWDWAGVVPLVAERTRVVVLDMVGFGQSDKPLDGTYEDHYSLFKQADRYEAVAKKEGLREVMLVIHDMGQSVGAELMKRQQEGKLPFKIRHAIVFNGSTLINLVQLNDLQKKLLGMPDELGPNLPAETFVEGLRGTFSKEHSASDETLDIMAAQILYNDGDRVMPRIIRYMKERQEELERWGGGIANFNGPVSMFWGLQDPVSVEKMADTWKDMQPRIELHKWPDVGHWPSIEVPDRVAKKILDRY